MTESPWLFPFSDGISASLSSLAYGPSDCGKNRHYAKKSLLIKAGCFAKSSWNVKNNSYGSSYTGALSCPCQSGHSSQGPVVNQFLVRKAPFCSKTSREPFTYLKWSLCLSKPHVPSPSKGHTMAGLALPRWGRGRNDWVTSQPHLAWEKGSVL